MAHITADRIVENSTTAGTGALTLIGAPSGFRSFASKMAVGDTCHYLIEVIDESGRPNGQYEFGIGTYSAANTLTRTTVIGSSNANAAVAFAEGQKRVALTILAPDSAAVKGHWRSAIGLADTSGLAEGSTNLYYTDARVRAAPLTGLSTSTSTAITASDTVLTAPGKLQAQVTALGSSKADLNSPALTGTPTAPTKDREDASTGLATTQFVKRMFCAPGGSPAGSDWNNETTPGVNRYLMQAGAANAPASGYYYDMTLAYSSEDGSGNVTQVAIPYATAGGAVTSIYFRGRFSNEWGAWKTLLDSSNHPTFVRATTLTGLSTATNTPVVATDTLLEAIGKLQAQMAPAIPSGAIQMFARATPPSGWLKANGGEVHRLDYPELFSAIGTTFGAGDGSTTFNLPDLRGTFLRGLDDGRGLDAGRTLGSYQDSANLAHNHGVSDPGHNHYVNDPSHQHGGSTAGAGGHAHGTRAVSIGSGTWGQFSGGFVGDAATDGVGDHTHNFATDWRGTGIWLSASGTGISIQNNGGAESRPRNVALLACIKI